MEPGSDPKSEAKLGTGVGPQRQQRGRTPMKPGSDPDPRQSAVVGSMTDRTSEMLSTGNPPADACLRTMSGSVAR